MDNHLRTALTAEIGVLGPHAYSSLAEAIDRSRARVAGLDRKEYPHALPMMVRCDLRERFKENGLPDGWELTGDSRLMGQLSLTNQDADIDVRFLKERKSYVGGTPPAGRNPARRRAWTNGDGMAWSIQDQPLEDLAIVTEEPKLHRLLMLWDNAGARAEDGFKLRVVRPIAPGRYGRKVPLDFSLDVLPGGTIFDNREFVGDDEDIDLYAAEIDEAVDGDD
ncbi:hypothetical protein [Nocardioides psychrotolerans]|uniref:hypothetical protein n=1 Tax=Nocardioides psychrotolerans TaxID=1005945 RepID=UPI003138239E